MAVIQYTALVNQIRGKVNGSVLNKARTVNTVQKKQQQSKGNKGFQYETRQDFSQGQRTWKELTPTQQESWALASQNNPSRDRFGNQVVISGYNQFIKAWMLARYANTYIDKNGYPAPAPANTLTVESIYNQEFWVNENGGVSVNFYMEDYSVETFADFGIIWDISLPLSAGVTTYHGRWVNVYGYNLDGSQNTNRPVDLGRAYPLPVPGQRVLWRGRIVHFQTGAVVATAFGELSDWVLRPSITSFTATPTTGIAPYRLSVQLENKLSLDNLHFALKVFAFYQTEACPVASAISIRVSSIENYLLLYGAYDLPDNVPSNNCLGIKAQIVRLLDNSVVQESVVYISNL